LIPTLKWWMIEARWPKCDPQLEAPVFEVQKQSDKTNAEVKKPKYPNRAN